MVVYPNFLVKVTRVMAPFITHPYQSVMTNFMNMRIKGTNSSWSFCTPGLGRTSAPFCYTTPLFLSFTDPGIGPHSWHAKVCVKENNAYPTPTCKTIRKSTGRYIWHVFYPRVQYSNNVQVYMAYQYI